jgi:hypothetical protein
MNTKTKPRPAVRGSIQLRPITTLDEASWFPIDPQRVIPLEQLSPRHIIRAVVMPMEPKLRKVKGGWAAVADR